MKRSWTDDAEEQLRALARELRAELAEKERELRRLRKEVKAQADELRSLRARLAGDVTPISSRRSA